jgi:hypothetical protein
MTTLPGLGIVCLIRSFAAFTSSAAAITQEQIDHLEFARENCV